MGIFRQISVGWQLGVASWRVLLDNKVLMIFPLLSLISSVIVFSVFATGGAVLGLTTDIENLQGTEAAVAYLVGLFLIYTVFNTITIFFNVGLISCAGRALSAQPAKIGKGLADAFTRLPYILMWAMISSTVSILLNIIEQQKWVGRIVALILGGLWNIVTYLVLPVIAFERVGPIKAFNRSSQLILETWGENLGGRIGIGLISFLMMIPALGFVFAAGALELPLLLIGAGVWVFLVLLWAATAGTILQVAVYAYACSMNLRTDYYQNLDELFYGKAGSMSASPARGGKMDMIRVGSGGDTELHRAINDGNFHVVDIMLKRGADVMARGEDGATPYERAVALGRNDIAERIRKAIEESGRNPFEK